MIFQAARVVFIPKCRKKQLYGQVRKFLGPVFRELARQKECLIIEGRMMADHVHTLIEILPKYAASTVIGFIKFGEKRGTTIASLGQFSNP